MWQCVCEVNGGEQGVAVIIFLKTDFWQNLREITLLNEI